MQPLSGSITGRIPFDRWEFAMASPKETDKITNYFGMSSARDQGQIVHSMSTSVISPEGKIYKWYDENGWNPRRSSTGCKRGPLGKRSKARAQAHEVRRPSRGIFLNRELSFRVRG